jgi:hypothetical protein
MKHKEASSLRVGRVELAGATDENGVPLELSAYDLERMGREAVLVYQERLARQQRKTRRAERERDELEE